MPRPQCSSTTLSRIQACTSWLQARAFTSSECESNRRERECAALADILAAENDARHTLRNLGFSVVDLSPARCPAMLALCIACVHLPDAAEKYRLGTGIVRLHCQAMNWVLWALTNLDDSGQPSRTQLALALALLRGHALHGCSRQLANLADALASAMAAHASSQQSLQSANGCTRIAVVLTTFLHAMEGLLIALLLLRKKAVTASPDNLCADSSPLARGPAGGMEASGRHQDEGGETEQRGCQQGNTQHSAGATGVLLEEVERELHDAIGSSGVVENVSRAMLLVARWLQAVQQHVMQQQGGEAAGAAA